MALPSSASGKSWVLTFAGWRAGPFPAAVGIGADKLLLLGIHADDRVPGILMRFDLIVDVAELAIAVRVLGAFDGLGVCLQAEVLLTQQISDRVGTDPVTLPGQLRSQRAGGLGRP